MLAGMERKREEVEASIVKSGKQLSDRHKQTSVEARAVHANHTRAINAQKAREKAAAERDIKELKESLVENQHKMEEEVSGGSTS